MSNDGNPEKPPTDKEIKKFLRDVIKAFKPLASKLAGESVPMSYDENLFQNIKKFIDLAYEHTQKENIIKNENTSELIKAKKRIKLMDDFLNSLFNSKSDNPLFELAQLVNPKNSYEIIIPDVDYRTRMRGTIQKIIYTIDQMGKLEQLDNFINSMGIDNVFAMSQSANRLNLIIPYVIKTRKRITKDIVEQYVEDYKEISGFMEPLIIILYGMQQIMKNSYKPFTEIKEKFSIGRLLNNLKNDQMFSVLIGKYDLRTRNSIMHVSYHIDPNDKKIEFNDRGKKFSLTYFEFIEYVQEVVRISIILCHIENEIKYLKLLGQVEQRHIALGSDTKHL